MFLGCFEQKSYVHSRDPYGFRAAPYEFCLPVQGSESFNACMISLRALYGFRDHKQPMNNPCGDRTGSVRAPYATCDARAGLLQILVVSIPLRAQTYTSHETTCARQLYLLYFIMIWMNFEYNEIPIEVESRHYDDAIMSTIASQITSLTIVYLIVYSDTDHRKHQSSASLAFVRGIH